MGRQVDLVIRNATLVSHAGHAVGDVAIDQGRITGLGQIGAVTAAEEIDAKGLHLLPGVIDSQVHFREPGNEHKEDLESGSRAAVMGGVTAVFEMPNTKPSTSTASALADKIARAKDRMWCDFAFYVGATGDNAESLADLELHEGCCGVKVFMGSSTGDLLVSDDEALLRVLQSGRRRVAIHAEDEERLLARQGHRAVGDPASHPIWRDEETALRATRRIVALARRAGRRIHVLHITTGEEMAFLAANKDIASVETTPQHLTLDAETAYARLGTFAQMNPPIRGSAQREALWAAVLNGTVDVIGSDHAPHSLDEKALPYPQSPSGMPGVQTLLPLLLTHAANGRLSLERVVDLTSTSVNRLFNLRSKGRLAMGYDADFSLVDLKRQWTIEENWLAARCGWSPFTGMEMIGKPVATIVRGRVVMRDDELIGTAHGQPIAFQETIRPA
ncbi:MULTISPECIES: dihydroorotase [unclassified Iodidimonas]|jgi:dihydroorotase|uniref:dihydroorotase n=1 Tax=unclassified Iodidimonas TaxID=2626145 RepID=UPI002482375D|nr:MULTISPECIES: dihydroorotase [unclassified Iodidimonas]